jgi:hypothetical protein
LEVKRNAIVRYYSLQTINTTNKAKAMNSQYPGKMALYGIFSDHEKEAGVQIPALLKNHMVEIIERMYRSQPDYKSLYEKEKALREAAEAVVAKNFLGSEEYLPAYNHYQQLKQQQ